MFRTEISNIPARFKIDLKDQALLLGSCFALEIGKKMQENKFQASINPAGIIFNPISLFELIDYAINDLTPADSTFLEREEVFYNYKYHSALRETSQHSLEKSIKVANAALKEALTNAQLIVFTFGTAWAYRKKEEDFWVANCHKVPQTEFDKRLLSVAEIVDAFKNTYELIQAMNPEVKILLTVSPVRHLKDTLTLNSVSKATLRLVCHELCEAYEQVDYFPAFELLNDDLRDYRFYTTDMLHPNEQAVDYVWTKFVQSHLSRETQDFLAQWTKLKSALTHKPFNPASASHQQFLNKTLHQLEQLGTQVDLTQEIASLQSQLQKT